MPTKIGKKSHKIDEKISVVEFVLSEIFCFRSFSLQKHHFSWALVLTCVRYSSPKNSISSLRLCVRIRAQKKRGLMRIYLTAVLGKPLANKWNKSPRHTA